MASTLGEMTLWDESGTEGARAQAEILQSVAGGPPGYRLRRIVLTNFWLYEHQIFEIPHGRLFLAGDNQSGKSTVLVAAITLALDGDTHPERIDTFGKREKRIDYYIVGSNESNTPFLREQRSSYVALEFEWCDPQHPPFSTEARSYWERGEYEKCRFLTIGLAFAGNRNNATPVTTTRFLITDGSRIEYDIPTVQVQSAGSRAVDVRTFKKAINEHGILCDTQREYEQKVAHALFNFNNMDDFHRLIRLLLYLRQPNLNSVLSLETIRGYLDQSLPALPVDLIQSAATTIELMDSLQAEIERRQKAYNAVERLHKAQQIVTMGQARIAAYIYIQDQLKTNEAQREVQRYKRAITRSEHDLQAYQERLSALLTEEQELTGKIKALQGRAEIQSVQDLAQARQVVVEREGELQERSQILADAVNRREQIQQELEEHLTAFQGLRQRCIDELTLLQTGARKDALWPLAADQVADVQQQVRQFTLDAATPALALQISSLQSVSLEERLQWLRSLKGLHHEIETTTIQLQAQQKQEALDYQALEQVGRKCEQQRDLLINTQQTFVDDLSLLLEQDFLWQSSLTPLRERAEMVWNETGDLQETVQHLGALIKDFTDLYTDVQNSIKRTNERIQQDLQRSLSEQGAKKELVAQAQSAYEQKAQEPEFMPARSLHRHKARSYLESHGISSRPLYMLFDFGPAIDSEGLLAGGIEQVLEDAGLLDTLVISPADLPRAVTLLAEADLSDCYLEMAHPSVDAGQDQPIEQQFLRIDPQLQVIEDEHSDWVAIGQTVLRQLEATLYPGFMDAQWRHGLLRGTRGAGSAHYIGKATRVREQQKMLEALRLHWLTLSNELATIEQHITDLRQQLQDQDALLLRLDAIYQESEMERHYQDLQGVLASYREAERAYQRSHSEAQATRVQSNALKTRLIRETGETPIFASDSHIVDHAYDTTQRLASEYSNVHGSLDTLRSTWQAYKKADKQLAQDKAAEWRVEQLRQKAERELVQVRATLEIYEQRMQGTTAADIAAMAEQLERLQVRQHSLPEDLQQARTKIEVIESAQDDQQAGYQRAQDEYAQALQRSDESYQQLLARMEMYPVEMLNVIKQEMGQKSSQETAESVLAEPVAPPEEAYTQRNKLEQNRTRAQNELYQIASEVNNLLHDYGPRYDEQGIIHFVNVDDANALELLMRLGEEIRQHEQLLEIRERELFQNFLLQEMADSVGKHIIAAEQWVERMNAIFSQTEFVGSYYQLKWVIKKQEQVQSEQHLAHYHELLRRQAQTFKQDEIDALVYAFRQEINQLRAQAQVAGSATFTDALASVFDYRNWFQFEIYMSRPDNTWQHLTNRFMKKGSGAEQYVALYIPFFAALSALYESAGQGAPRLIALDEAFDKVSDRNTRNLLQFLATQHFQWLMTGPHISGEGAQIPACVKYTMFSQKEEEIAAGFPAFWSTATDLTLAEE